MPTICVAAGCSNQKDKAKGISLHVIPFFEDERPEAKRRRKKWVDFVKQKRAKWQPSKHSVICSVHFKPEDFERRFDCLQQGGKAPSRWLRKVEFGCCVPNYLRSWEKHNRRTIKARETHGKSLLYKISHLWSFCLLIVKVSVSTLLEICISSGYKSSNGNSKDCLL